MGLRATGSDRGWRAEPRGHGEIADHADEEDVFTRMVPANQSEEHDSRGL